MKQVLGAINRQAEVNYAQVLNRTLLLSNKGFRFRIIVLVLGKILD